MPPRASTRKAAVDAKEKLTPNEGAPAPAEAATEPATGDAAGGAAAAAAEAGGVVKEEEAKIQEQPHFRPEDLMEEASEERSGDQPVVEDDATTAPVPDRVRARPTPGYSFQRAQPHRWPPAPRSPPHKPNFFFPPSSLGLSQRRLFSSQQSERALSLFPSSAPGASRRLAGVPRGAQAG
jgi:hypothetical protein